MKNDMTQGDAFMILVSQSEREQRRLKALDFLLQEKVSPKFIPLSKTELWGIIQFLHEYNAKLSKMKDAGAIYKDGYVDALARITKLVNKLKDEYSHD